MSQQRPQRPDPLSFEPGAVPELLRDREQWVCWRYQWDNDRGEWTKIPVDPSGSGGYAKSTDPDTWGSFGSAVGFHDRTGTDTDGVGFVVGDEGVVMGVDLDDCRDPDTGELEPWAETVVDEISTYWEASPSGTGLRAFGLGFLPDGGTRADIEDAEGHIEMYDTGRYLTVTGHQLDDAPPTVEQVNSSVDSVHSEYIAEDETPEPDSPAENPTPETDKSGSSDLSDSEIVQKAKNAENGDKFRRLWNGSTSGYPSHSEARQALANLLAFWTGGDKRRMLSLFRQSDLLRDDDDLRTFENYEIPTALEGRTEFYDPDRGSSPSNPAAADNGAESDSDESSNIDGPTWREAIELYQQAEGSDERDAARYQAAEVLLDNHDWANIRENDLLNWYDPTEGVYHDAGESKLREIVRNRLGSIFKTSEVSELSEHIRAVETVPADDMGGPAEKIAVQNGVLDLSDGSYDLLEHSPHYRFLSRLGTEYDPDADCPTWRECLDTWCTDDSDRKKLQEYAGYTLMHWRLKWHKALFLVGPQGSGKSTFADTIRSLHGADRVASLSPQELTQRFGGAELRGKWVNIRNDIPRASVQKTGTLKEIIAGDPIKAERKGKDPFHFTPTAKHIFVANQLPDTETDDAAFYRRILLTAFPHTVPRDERDRDLDDKLQAELPGILNWALEGLNRLREQGGFTGDLTPGLTAEEWDKWGHTVDRFASACLEIGDAGNVEPIPKEQLYNLYQTFCEEESMPCEMQQAMTRRLKTEHSATDGKATVSGKQQRCFLNVSLTSRAEQYQSDENGDSGRSGLGSFD